MYTFNEAARNALRPACGWDPGDTEFEALLKALVPIVESRRDAQGSTYAQIGGTRVHLLFDGDVIRLVSTEPYYG